MKELIYTISITNNHASRHFASRGKKKIWYSIKISQKILSIIVDLKLGGFKILLAAKGL